MFPYATLNNPLCSPPPGCNPMCLGWISPQLFVLQQVWLLCVFLPVTTSEVWLRLYCIALAISHYRAFLALYGLREASLQFALIDNFLWGRFYCFCLKRGVWWARGNTVRGLGARGVCVYVVVSELRSRIQGWILDPKWAQHLSLHALINIEYRLQTLINIDGKLCYYPFFLAMFPSYRNQSIDLQCNQLTGFYMRESCHEKGQ